MRVRRSSRWVAFGLSLLFAGAAQAVRHEISLSGEVLNVAAGQKGDATAGLSALGVRSGRAVSVVFGVETNTPGMSSPAGTHYLNPITDIAIQIGDFQASLDPTQLNQVIVSDNFGSPPVDTYTLNAFLIATNDLLGFGANAVMGVSSLDGQGFSGENLDQILEGMIGSIAVGGVDAIISATLGDFRGGGGRPRPPVCLPGQIGSGGALCRAVLLCAAKYVPFDPSFEACVGKAEEKFVKSFNKAADKAGKKGEICPSGIAGSDAAGELADDVDPLSALIAQSVDESKDGQKYRASAFKNTGNAVGKALKAFAKDAKKPDDEKLQKALDKVEEKLRKGLAKGEDKAVKKGVAPAIDIDAVVEAVEELVGAVLEVSGGS